MADAASQLQEAYDLIEAGDLQSARQLLDDIKSDNENNPDFWWVYAHAIQDESEGRQALERVAQLAPNYPGLSDIYTGLGMTPPQVKVQAQTSDSPPPPLPPNAPSTEDVDEFHEVAQLTNTEGSNNWLIYAGVLTVIVLIVVFLLLNALSGNTNDNLDETPTTSVVVGQTAEPIIPTVAEADAETVDETSPTDVPATNSDTVEVTDDTTEESVTEVEATAEPVAENEVTEEVSNTQEESTTEPVVQTEATEEVFDTETEASQEDGILASAEELAIFSVPADGITIENTQTFGESYVIVTCSPLGPIATQNIVNIVDSLIDSADTISDSIGGFAFRVTDCNNDTTTLTLGFDIETLNEYWAGEITQAQLQQNLQRVNS